MGILDLIFGVSIAIIIAVEIHIVLNKYMKLINFLNIDGNIHKIILILAFVLLVAILFYLAKFLKL